MGQLVAALSLAKDSQGSFPRDSGYRQANRHALRKVAPKGLDGINKIYHNLTSSKQDIQSQQDGNFRKILEKYLYPSKDINYFLRYGNLPQVIDRTFEWYLLCLMDIIGQANQHGWENSLAPHILDHMNKKLWNLRRHSTSKVVFLMQVYVFFRDFVDQKMRVPEIHSAFSLAMAKQSSAVVVPSPSTPSTPSFESKCNWCYKPRLHRLFQPSISEQQTDCPFKLLTRKEAKEKAKKVLAAFDADSNQHHIDTSFIEKI